MGKTTRFGVVVLDKIECVKASAGVNADVIAALGGVASAYYSGVGAAALGVDDARAKALGALATGLAGVASGLPDLITKMAAASDDPDDVQLRLAKHETPFFPGGDGVLELRSGEATSLLTGRARVVPYLLGAASADSDFVRVAIWDKDPGADDHMGAFEVQIPSTWAEPEVSKANNQAAIIVSEKHGGTVYIVNYRLITVDVDDVAVNTGKFLAGMFHTSSGDLAFAGAKEGFVFPQLKALGVAV